MTTSKIGKIFPSSQTTSWFIMMWNHDRSWTVVSITIVVYRDLLWCILMWKIQMREAWLNRLTYDGTKKGRWLYGAVNSREVRHTGVFIITRITELHTSMQAALATINSRLQMWHTLYISVWITMCLWVIAWSGVLLGMNIITLSMPCHLRTT